MTMFFEQTRGYDVFVDWFTDACSYHDEPKRRVEHLDEGSDALGERAHLRPLRAEE